MWVIRCPWQFASHLFIYNLPSYLFPIYHGKWCILFEFNFNICLSNLPMNYKLDKLNFSFMSDNFNIQYKWLDQRNVA